MRRLALAGLVNVACADWLARPPPLADAEKQASIDQFLNIVDEQKSLAIEMQGEPKRGYRDWFTPEHLEDVVSLGEAQRRIGLTIAHACDYWTEYYRPRLFTSFDRHFAMRILGSKSVQFLRQVVLCRVGR